jgi:hypothetical protein
MQDPQPIRGVLKQQRLPAGLTLVMLPAVATWILSARLGGWWPALAPGILIGAAIWSVLLVLAAQGWIVFDASFDD